MRYTLVFFCLFISFNLNAQENRVVKKTNIISKDETLKIDNITFDVRVLRHYSSEALRNMPAKKRKELNYLYTDSYKIVNPENCPETTSLDIDIAKLEIFRKEDEDVIANFGNKCIVQVKLISKKELRKLFDSL